MAHSLGNRIKKAHSPAQTLYLLKSHEERRKLRRKMAMGLFVPAVTLAAWSQLQQIHAEIQPKLDAIHAAENDLFHTGERGRPQAEYGTPLPIYAGRFDRTGDCNPEMSETCPVWNNATILSACNS